MRKVDANPDPIFDSIDKHRLLAAQICDADNPKRQVDPEAFAQTMREMDETAWQFVDHPPLTIYGVRALLRYIVVQEAALPETAWPEWDCDKPLRPGRKFLAELHRTLADSIDSAWRDKVDEAA